MDIRHITPGTTSAFHASKEWMCPVIKQIFLLVVLIPFLANCALVPLPPEARDVLESAKSEFKTKSEEISLSEMRDQKVKNYATSIAEKLSHISGINVRLTVLETTEVQSESAYDNPEILITRGMLNSISNEAELASVISHEIGHKALGHKIQSKNSEFIESLFDKGTKKVLKNNALSDEVSSYRRDLIGTWRSQSQEEEADEFAVKLSIQAGYVAQVLPDLLERLSKLSETSKFQRLFSLKSTHKTLSDRADHLRNFISDQKFNAGGISGERKYREALKSLVKSQNAPQDQKSIGQARAINKEIEDFNRHKQKITIKKFIEMMSEISAIARKNKIDLSDWLTSAHKNSQKKKNGNGFLQETLKADSPFWASENSELSDALSKSLLSMSRLGIALIPGINNVTALYEVLSSKDFVSGQELGPGARALSAVGLAMGAGPEWRLLAAGIEQSLVSEGSQLARGEVQEIQNSVHVAEEVREESKLYGRSKLGEEFNHHIEKGPLEDKEAENFLGSKYREVFPKSGEKLYRVGDPEGNWWSRTKPSSQIKSMSENAILPEWNDFTHSAEITIPKGFNKPVYEGLSSSMGGKIEASGNYTGNFFHGGGNQIFIDNNVINDLVHTGAVTKGKL